MGRLAGVDIVAGSASFIESGANVWQWCLGPVMRYAFALSGAPRPKVCWLGTAHGDNLAGIRDFYGACSGETVEASHLQLFTMPTSTPPSTCSAAT